VPVYFDPDQPGDAVLVREAPSSILYIVGGVVILSPGVVLFWEWLSVTSQVVRFY
jgi:hypothetical protein